MILCGWKGLIFGYMFGIEGDGRGQGKGGWNTHIDYFFMSDYLEGETIDVEYLACPWSQSGR